MVEKVELPSISMSIGFGVTLMNKIVKFVPLVVLFLKLKKNTQIFFGLLHYKCSTTNVFFSNCKRSNCVTCNF